ncbi:MAG: hypothetical protein GC157_04030 [Frankiales bacterium]|nr:hypothetical protein [Frankiales bacterium]
MLSAALLLTLLTGCASSSPAPVVATGSGQPAAASSSAAASTSSASPVSSAPASPASASAPTFPPPVVLPQSVLARIPGVVYRREGGSDAETLAKFLAAAGPGSEPDKYLEGLILRSVEYQGRVVGGVEFIRFRQVPDRTGSDAVVHQVMADFAQAEPTAATVGSQHVWQVDRARGSSVGAVAWMRGTDLVLVFAGSLSDARWLAAAYLKAA